jgi:glucose-6-phosphate isomerase
VVDALKAQRRADLDLRFASNIDPADIADALDGLDPAKTLVIVVSKTFTTMETMTNAEAARGWLRAALGDGANAHLAAVTAAPERAQAWGVPEARLFPFWDTIGGRYSLWSAVGLSTEIALEAGAFEHMLAGAAQMDRHFREAPLPRNAPIIAALVQTWNRAALGRTSYAVCPYVQRLKLLPAYLQQLEMESNGKSVTRDGQPLAHSAAGVTWGEVGTTGQHSFFQLLHQGLDEIPVEFLLAGEGAAADAEARAQLHGNAVAQAEALLIGKTQDQVLAELLAQGVDEAKAQALAPHKTFPGDRASTLIGLARLSPETLGALLAFYEHRTFVQGVLAGVNPFDQWGVELGKAMAKDVASELTGAKPPGAHDPSTAAWIERLRRDQSA